MMKIRNTRSGILVIPDAGLKLAPDEVVEIDKPTKQIEAALKSGSLVEAEKDDGKPKPEPAKSTQVDITKLSATDAISMVSEEANPDTLKGYMETEKRRTVIDAMKSRLMELDVDAR